MQDGTGLRSDQQKALNMDMSHKEPGCERREVTEGPKYGAGAPPGHPPIPSFLVTEDKAAVESSVPHIACPDGLCGKCSFHTAAALRQQGGSTAHASAELSGKRDPVHP